MYRFSKGWSLRGVEGIISGNQGLNAQDGYTGLIYN